MSRLMRTSEISKRPVVTMGGDDVAQIKDVVYAADGGSVRGFTLAGRGLFAGPLATVLAWGSVAALGADAVMIEDEAALGDAHAILRCRRRTDRAARRRARLPGADRHGDRPGLGRGRDRRGPGRR